MPRATWIPIVVGLIAGCKSELNPAYCAAHSSDTRCPQSDGPVPGDGAGSADTIPMIDARACFGSGTFTVCLQDLPTDQVTITSNIDTDSQVPCLHVQPTGWVEGGQPAACFVVGTTLTLSGTVAAKGTRPLVFLATDTLTISGAIDVSAKHDDVTQTPGYSIAACTAFLATPAASNNGGGGGAGASFTTLGGGGGTGNNTASGAGAAPAAFSPTALRAGCGGQNGANGSETGGIGGNGGGGVYFVAGNAINVGAMATINASGAGGSGGGHQSGGGGAGSGGMIVFNAATISITTGAKIAANGGGGASGGSGSNGSSGSDPSITNPTNPANGKTGSGGAGSGGNGYAVGVGQDAVAGTGGTANNGGGGGGGGAGYVQSNHALNNAVVSPAELVIP